MESLQEKLQPYRMEMAKDSTTAALLLSEFETSISTPAMVQSSVTSCCPSSSGSVCLRIMMLWGYSLSPPRLWFAVLKMWSTRWRRSLRWSRGMRRAGLWSWRGRRKTFTLLSRLSSRPSGLCPATITTTTRQVAIMQRHGVIKCVCDLQYSHPLGLNSCLGICYCWVMRYRSWNMFVLIL